MRVVVIIKANKDSEAGKLPSERYLGEMLKFNEQLINAGIMLAGEGLHPSSKAKRVRFTGDGQKSVVDGPFTETKELVAGFWIWQVRSIEEAVEWVKRIPAPTKEENPNNESSEIEIRPVFEADDFGKEMTPEIRAQEERLRAQAAQRQ
jgi:hypothetical protein